jgi:hypothetical protein
MIAVPRCAKCGALIVYGKPQIIREHHNNGVIEEVPYCDLCMDEICWGLWDEETMGPFVSKLPHRRYGGHT